MLPSHSHLLNLTYSLVHSSDRIFTFIPPPFLRFYSSSQFFITNRKKSAIIQTLTRLTHLPLTLPQHFLLQSPSLNKHSILNPPLPLSQAPQHAHSHSLTHSPTTTITNAIHLCPRTFNSSLVSCQVAKLIMQPVQHNAIRSTLPTPPPRLCTSRNQTCHAVSV